MVQSWYMRTSFLLTYLLRRDHGSPRTTAVDRRSDSIHSGGPTSSSADFSVDRCPGNASMLRRVFPDHLITFGGQDL